MKKRIVSTLLTLCMVLMLCPVTAFAEDLYSTLTWNFQYGTLIHDGVEQKTSPYVCRINRGYSLSLVDVENCSPYEFVGWKEAGSGTVYKPAAIFMMDDSEYTFDAVYQVQGSLAVTVDGFEVGKTPADCTYSFESTIPGVDFSEDDIQRFYWEKYIFAEETSNLWYLVYKTEAFEAGASYRISMNLDNKGLDMAPAVTVNGRTPHSCKIATRDGVPIQLQIACTLGTPAEQSQYTITYDGGEGVEGSIPAGTKTPGEDFTLSSETFTWDGYVQTGWVDKETGAIYDLGATYDEDRDATLYPYWEKLITVTAPFTTTVALGDAGEPGETTFMLGLIDGLGNELTFDDQYFFAEITTDGAGSYSGVMTITATEKWLYDMLYEGAFIWQYDGEEDGWTYDDTVWGVRLYMPEVAARSADEASYKLLLYPTYVMDDGCFNLDLNAGPVEEMTFTNIYTKTVTEPTEPTKNSPQTGDNSHMALWIALLLVSGAGVIGTTVYGKKKRAK